MKLLAILGASGHGKVVAEAAEMSGWIVQCFFDDAYPEKQKNSNWSVVGNMTDLLNRLDEFDAIHVAIGDNQTRLSKLDILREAGATLATIIHPSASISKSARLKDGVAVLANSAVNAQTTIGTGSILNTNSSVDHDCKLGEGVHISPGVNLGGYVKVGDRSWIGIGSVVIQFSEIGKDVTIGAGSAVVSNIPDLCVAVGVPSKITRHNKKN